MERRGQNRREVSRSVGGQLDGQLPRRPDLEAAASRIVGLYERFVRAHPEHADSLLERCEEVTRRFRSPGTERVLTTDQARRFTGLSRARIQQLAAEGTCGRKVGEHWRFSEDELDAYLRSPRLQGPKKKPQESI